VHRVGGGEAVVAQVDADLARIRPEVDERRGATIAVARSGHLLGPVQVPEQMRTSGRPRAAPHAALGDLTPYRSVRERAGVDVAVIISDTFGRPWREGVVNVAIGVAGMDPLESFVGKTDPHGYELHATIMAPADELASAAELVMGKLRQAPAVVVRGYPYVHAEGSSRALVRDAAKDLFR